MSDDVMLPCSECGTEIFGTEDTTTTIEEEYEFQGKKAERTVAAKICPECGATTAL